jgi:hypothetical protein
MIQKQSNNPHSGIVQNHQQQKKVRQVWSSTNSMLIFFFQCKGDCSLEFVPHNTTVNSDFYCDVLRCLREKCDEKD